MITVIADSKTCAGMRPEIIPGDSLYIDTKERTGADGIYLVQIKGTQRVGRIITTDYGKWLVLSNPAYKAAFVPTEELDTMKILGKIVKQVRSY